MKINSPFPSHPIYKNHFPMSKTNQQIEIPSERELWAPCFPELFLCVWLKTKHIYAVRILETKKNLKECLEIVNFNQKNF